MFLSLKINFVFVNGINFDKMLHSAAFYLSLHCLQKYLFRGFHSTKGYVKKNCLNSSDVYVIKFFIHFLRLK